MRQKSAILEPGGTIRAMSMRIAAFLLFLLFTASCSNNHPISSWERHCEACHDGKTVLNGKVVMDKEQMKAKYKTLTEFLNACQGYTSCMNILKHREGLLREVGREIGIANASDN